MKIRRTATFKKQYVQLRKRHFDTKLLDRAIIAVFDNDKAYLASARDHQLKGKFKGERELHIKGDWLLRYRIDGNFVTLILIATGTHRDVLGIE